MVVWSLVEASVAVITACLPTIRHLFFEHSIQSLVGNIRSLLSSNSLGRWHKAERRGSDSEALANRDGMNPEPIRASESKSSRLETKITGNADEIVDVPANRIMMRNGIAFKEEYLTDLEANEFGVERKDATQKA